MNVINREFKEVGTGEIFKIIDVYQNIAVTNNRDRVDVKRLLDTKYYIPIGSGYVAESIDNRQKVNIHTEDYVDPETFLSGKSTLESMIANQIKSLSTDNLPDDVPVSIPSNSNMIPSINESAIIIDDGYDEAAELAKKYGASHVSESIRSQNAKFANLLDPEEFPEILQPQSPQVDTQGSISDNKRQSYDQRTNPSVSPTQHIMVDDPITSIFRGVKRSVDFSLDLKLKNKLPRLDFIEMMEDSYQVSIIDFLAEEFADEFLKNPNLLKKMISDEIRSIVYSKELKTPREKSKVTKVTKRTYTRKSNQNIGNK